MKDKFYEVYTINSSVGKNLPFQRLVFHPQGDQYNGIDGGGKGMFEGGVWGEKNNSANYWCGEGKKEAHPPTTPLWGQIPVE